MASAADAKAYNEALSYLKMYGAQSGQAAGGTDALMVLPGVLGALVRGTVAAGGAYQTGTGIGQIADGNYSDGALNVGLGTAAIFSGIAGQNITSKAENALTNGQITYEFGAKPDSNELRAGNTFSQLGYDVTYKTTASDKGLQNVRTQDLWVNGVGKVDVYTPQSTKPKSIINTIEKKDSQTSSVFTQVDLTGEEMSGIASRVWGKPNIKNINTLFFQDSTGKVYRFERPKAGGN